jgi:hypothetical protein
MSHLHAAAIGVNSLQVVSVSACASSTTHERLGERVHEGGATCAAATGDGLTVEQTGFKH